MPFALPIPVLPSRIVPCCCHPWRRCCATALAPCRYLVGLLVFLGLLGTFWGLLDTIQSVGKAISALDTKAADSVAVFDDLKNGLAAPLRGMGTAFSSSLLGLGGSLVLGFLELQASHAHGRFYNQLEEWLSGITELAPGTSQ